MDTIEDGLNGFKYEKKGGSWEEWDQRMTEATSLSPEKIRTRALELYNPDLIMDQYLNHLNRIKADPGSLLIDLE
jgi:hypothetical protein